LIEKGCLHPIDKAAVSVAAYTGLRPGSDLALCENSGSQGQGQSLVRAVGLEHEMGYPDPACQDPTPGYAEDGGSCPKFVPKNRRLEYK
jgi:hypothetical protein